MDEDELREILASLEREQVDYVLIGGTALIFHGLVRTTEDVDIFVRPDPLNIERLRQALRAVYADPSIDEISTEDLCGEYPAVRYYPPERDIFLDILTRLGEFARYEDIRAQEIDYEGMRVKVATPETLYWLKKDTVRAIDRADAQALRTRFNLEE